MKKTVKSIVSLIFAVSILCSLLVVPVSAAEIQASNLISNHSCNASAAGGGKISVGFSITAKGTMSRLGAQSMYFYAENGSLWSLKESYGPYDTGMSAADKFTYSNTLTYQGTSGVKYKVVVTLFAKNSAGTSDTRDYTFYVTA